MIKNITKLNQNNNVLKIIYFIIGIFISAFVYNLVFVPNNIVTGGVSGLAIVIKKLTGLSTYIFIDIANVFLIVISYIFLGKKETGKHLLGAILYPLTVTLTSSLTRGINIEIESKLILYIFAALVYGIGNGLTYRAGYSTGGFDIITHILSNKFKKTITTISPILNISVIALSGVVFNPVKIMESVLVIYLSNKTTNAILFSISTNKMIYIISKKNRDIEKYVLENIHAGATEINAHSGLFERKKQILLCIVHNRQYKNFKHKILEMDPSTFFLAKNCYEVSGGIRYTLIPF